MLYTSVICLHKQPFPDLFERVSLASYLASFVQSTHAHSPEAATYIEFAINEIAPEAPAIDPDTHFTRDELTAALSRARSDLQAGSGPYVCISAALDILHGWRCQQGTA